LTGVSSTLCWAGTALNTANDLFYAIGFNASLTYYLWSVAPRKHAQHSVPVLSRQVSTLQALFFDSSSLRLVALLSPSGSDSLVAVSINSSTGSTKTLCTFPGLGNGAHAYLSWAFSASETGPSGVIVFAALANGSQAVGVFVPSTCNATTATLGNLSFEVASVVI